MRHWIDVTTVTAPGVSTSTMVSNRGSEEDVNEGRVVAVDRRGGRGCFDGGGDRDFGPAGADAGSARSGAPCVGAWPGHTLRGWQLRRKSRAGGRYRRPYPPGLRAPPYQHHERQPYLRASAGARPEPRRPGGRRALRRRARLEDHRLRWLLQQAVRAGGVWLPVRGRLLPERREAAREAQLPLRRLDEHAHGAGRELLGRADARRGPGRPDAHRSP